MDTISKRTRKIANLAVLLAMITVLSAVEHALPPLPMMPPNVRFGLSNIITMYALFFLGTSSAVTLAVLKSLFVALMRGPVAGALSLSGGLLSVAVLVLLLVLSRDRLSYLILSIAGAIAHNIGQMITASLILSTNLVVPFLPVLLCAGVALGALTGTLLRVVMPLFHRMTGRIKP